MPAKAAKAKKPRRVRVKTGIYYALDAAGQKRFEIFYRDEERQPHWKRVPGGVRAAETARADILVRKGRGKSVKPVKLDFNEAADAWWTAQATGLSPNTQAAYGASLKRLRKVWGSRKLDTITVNAVAELIRDMEAEGRKGWTIKGCLTVIGRVFDYAGRRLNWRGNNPVSELDPSERPDNDEGEHINFTRVQLAAVIRQASAQTKIVGARANRRTELVIADHADDETEEFGPDPNRYSLIFWLASRTGMRLGETLGVKWGKLDFDAGTLSITHQLDRRGDYVGLKSKRSRRTIVLPTRLLAKLREVKLASAHSGKDDYVFLNGDGEGWDHRNIGGRALRRAMTTGRDEDGKPCWPELSDDDAEIDSSILPTFHSFRHTFASAFIANGGDLVTLSRHLGHSSPAVTARVYAGEFEAAERVEQERDRVTSMYGARVVTNLETPESQTAPARTNADDGKPAPVVPIANRRH